MLLPPIHLMVLKLKSLLGKVQGVMVSALYTSIGSYFALKSIYRCIFKINNISINCFSRSCNIIVDIPLDLEF